MAGSLRNEISNYSQNGEVSPLFLTGDCLDILSQIPDESVDCCITSPPYWGQRQYENGGIGQEATFADFITNVLLISSELRRVLKPTGSFWLNIDDTYRDKTLLGIPWRVAIAMIDDQHWTLRNNVIWHKHKGGLDSSKDKLRNVYEYFFHFVKDAKGYYYNSKQINSSSIIVQK